MINLVLITSIINTPNIELSYIKTRSVFSHDERYTQTKQTIKSVKEKIPNCKIILVECSDLTEDQNTYFNTNSDYFINLINNNELKENIYSKSKSLGEGTMTISALEYITNNNIKYDNLIKLSGRYLLSPRFDYNKYNNNNIIIKSINSNSVVTALYKLPYNYVNEYYIFLKSNINNMINCIGFETLFSIFLKTININNITECDPIGFQGNVSVSNDFYDG